MQESCVSFHEECMLQLTNGIMNKPTSTWTIFSYKQHAMHILKQLHRGCIQEINNSHLETSKTRCMQNLQILEIFQLTKLGD
jgi:hypothetical protein